MLMVAIFQHYYHYSVITNKNQAFIRLHFFNSFLRFLFLGGINEYEDPDQPFPSGYVQMMTIHQSKGLEFPVVIVGSLDTVISLLAASIPTSRVPANETARMIFSHV